MKPSVVSSAVGAPFRSISALVKSVVACTTRPIGSGARPPFSSSLCRPAIAPREGSVGVVLSFQITVRPSAESRTTKSVKVPPMSIPRESGAAPARWFW
jgi:hypothetical protein